MVDLQPEYEQIIMQFMPQDQAWHQTPAEKTLTYVELQQKHEDDIVWLMQKANASCGQGSAKQTLKYVDRAWACLKKYLLNSASAYDKKLRSNLQPGQCFPKFAELPNELQLMIWEFAARATMKDLPASETLSLKITNDRIILMAACSWDTTLAYFTRTPYDLGKFENMHRERRTLMSTCVSSRKVIIQAWEEVKLGHVSYEHDNVSKGRVCVLDERIAEGTDSVVQVFTDVNASKQSGVRVLIHPSYHEKQIFLDSKIG